jgi:Delta24-sterol reductase
VKDLAASIDHFHDIFQVYPLWLCPMRIPRNPRYATYGGFIRPLDDGDEMFVDVGAYGNPAYAGFNARSACRQAEDFVRAKKGYQVRDGGIGWGWD